MKKISFILLCILLLGGCSKPADNPKDPAVLGEIIECTPQHVLNKIDNKDTFFLFVSTTTCPICKEYKNVIQELIINYEVDVYHLEADIYTEEEMMEVKERLDNLTDAPDTFIYVDGELEYEYVGIILYRNLKELLVEHEIIK